MTKFVVLTNQRLTSTTQLLTLTNPDDNQVFNFQPGQYAAISFWRGGRPTTVRCFSIVSPPTDRGILQLGIHIKGKYTTALTFLQQGDPIEVHGAYGSFQLDHARDKQIVLLAGGIGITPFMSMIRYLTRLKHNDIKITLAYSCRSEHDVPFADELLELEQRHPNFQVVFIISDGGKHRFKDSKSASGRITPAILDKITGGVYLGKTFFMCGSLGFMDAIGTTLLGRGAPDDRVISEAFGQMKNPQKESSRDWPRIVYGMTSIGLVVGLMLVMFTDFVLVVPALSINPPDRSLGAPTISREASDQLLASQVNTMSSNLPATKTGSRTTSLPTSVHPQ
ncbi:MAG: FAD-binding oxidoreductase [Candidatus Saccharibacteria bacterium]